MLPSYKKGATLELCSPKPAQTSRDQAGCWYSEAEGVPPRGNKRTLRFCCASTMSSRPDTRPATVPSDIRFARAPACPPAAAAAAPAPREPKAIDAYKHQIKQSVRALAHHKCISTPTIHRAGTGSRHLLACSHGKGRLPAAASPAPERRGGERSAAGGPAACAPRLGGDWSRLSGPRPLLGGGRSGLSCRCGLRGGDWSGLSCRCGLRGGDWSGLSCRCLRLGGDWSGLSCRWRLRGGDWSGLSCRARLCGMSGPAPPCLSLGPAPLASFPTSSQPSEAMPARSCGVQTVLVLSKLAERC